MIKVQRVQLGYLDSIRGDAALLVVLHHVLKQFLGSILLSSTSYRPIEKLVVRQADMFINE